MHATKRSRRAAGEDAECILAQELFSTQDVKQLQASLLGWYDEHHRVLPWRRNPPTSRLAALREDARPADPALSQQAHMYQVWVCEVMSQQTQLARVVQYWTRWMAKWPTVQDLAAASEDEVNQLWAGLGYYRRARYLLQGAQHVVTELHGQFPVTAAGLMAIPGIGPYTARAIASITCHERVGAVDANVVRVMSRLRRLGADSAERGAPKLYAALADRLVDPHRPGDFNQALMELGATVCSATVEPDCAACPLREQCQGHADAQYWQAGGGDPADPGCPSVLVYPSKAKKARRRVEHMAVCLLEARAAGGAQGSFLVVKRPAKGLLAGLWEFPGAPVKPGASAQQQHEALHQLLQGLGAPQELLGSDAGRHLGTVSHTFSHIQMTLEVFHRAYQVEPWAGTAGSPEVKWLRQHELAGAGLSSSVNKCWALLQ